MKLFDGELRLPLLLLLLLLLFIIIIIKILPKFYVLDQYSAGCYINGL
jgi:hypothetical protein